MPSGKTKASYNKQNMTFFLKIQSVNIIYFLTPVIRYKFRETEWADLEKYFPSVESGPKMIYLPPFWVQHKFSIKIQNPTFIHFLVDVICYKFREI